MTRDTQLNVSDDSTQLVQCDNLDLEAGSKSPFAMLECVRNIKLLQKKHFVLDGMEDDALAKCIKSCGWYFEQEFIETYQ